MDPRIRKGVAAMTALTRPRDGRVIAGVCAGLAQRFGISSNAMRIIFVASCLLPGPQFLIYLALWVMMPNEDRARSYA
jgi:phage shock protein PspC (stress-responsive transcriptional regulator)